MKFEHLVSALRVAKLYNLKPLDFFILNEIFRANNNATTIMEIVANPASGASRVTVHAHVKKLYKQGFLTKTEDKENMKRKILEPGEAFKEFLHKIAEVEA